ncbi:MAG: aconitase/3-isopropylmalate dehydratase large subunit family protein [Alphaproteobacteria bacterium]|jgi:3-isopropylmalate/(R)-2-methylmalate dehydratase large subunit|nr:3-isopropylmalate dehydratase [Rhodospirillaceae bacterium]MDP6020079.1 aconitase/3-isopropylmalate dehydratase large subunit family protein [Alphaproteobacteria bacterium]MDP6257061.1 aconitase/3-isopropylmalate dehydratase large subunit family protein [Alphaproteobacteria bacterium]MDP7054080.1 aconitase/3-isopropylmalate dehydratase large subunit family protein [Alphaproteobacteria bacterium]MDP7227391.1 aconitase/3-isopropylmalate dehydratase large subunit family protein [Alphaproteobact|tara:strand:- start:1098 stop:2351 length:1254 start_codon:yes stop_codon:yes gene_type:complete
MGMTTIEKILACNSEQAEIRPSDIVTTKVETAILFDNNFMATTWREILHVHDPDKVVVVFDHRAPASHVLSAQAHQTGRKFVKRFGISRFHDIGFDQGISHAIVADYGYGLPGTVLLCSDSHTCSAGVFNLAARGVGAPDMTYAVTKGETWFQVGETVRYELEGGLRPGVSAKDIFLHLAGTYGDHATLNVEYGGPGLAGLSMNARRTLTTMSAELSVEFATFEPDDVMLDFVRARTDRTLQPVWPDEDAVYADKRVIRLDQIEPLVALPDAVLNNSKPVADVSGQAIDQAFIGSCANGTLDDLAVAARVLKGNRVHDGVRLLVTPATQNIYREALRRGYVLTITEAGGVVTNATCGACGGGSLGVLGPGETCITASTRNFKGRMGDPEARIYMASPATVAASALQGCIASPLEHFQ